MYDLSVLIATHNGQGVLKDTLNGYIDQKAEGISWQIIVVNNKSSDSTREILESYKEQLPLIILECDRPGKNKALNSALHTIESDFVIVSDDDAIPAEDFLREWLNVKNDLPDYDLFGGSITPKFQDGCRPPSWMCQSEFHWEEIYAVRKLPSGPINAIDIFGPNMAVRKTVFDNGITFNEDIGPDGTNKNYPMGSETEFCRRVEEAGYKAFFNAGSRVEHIIRPHQIRPDFWFKRAYKHGLGFGMQEKILDKKGIKSAYKKAKRLVKAYLYRGLAIVLFLSDQKEHDALWQFYWEKGYIKGRFQE